MTLRSWRELRKDDQATEAARAELAQEDTNRREAGVRRLGWELSHVSSAPVERSAIRSRRPRSIDGR